VWGINVIMQIVGDVNGTYGRSWKLLMFHGQSSPAFCWSLKRRPSDLNLSHGAWVKNCLMHLGMKHPFLPTVLLYTMFIAFTWGHGCVFFVCVF
jgi:hypothetical protein